MLSDVGDDLVAMSMSMTMTMPLNTTAVVEPSPSLSETHDRSLISYSDTTKDVLAISSDNITNHQHSVVGTSGSGSDGEGSGGKGRYASSQMSKLADHLNTMNRRAKRVQHDCQRLFLYLYLSNKTTTYTGLIYALRNNGFLAYIPDLDIKRPVYLDEADNGSVKIDPLLLQSIRSNSKDMITKDIVSRDYKCVLILDKLNSTEDGCEEKPSHLVICRKNMDPDMIVSQSPKNVVDGYLVLRPLQRVTIQITTRGDCLSNGNNIQFELVGIEVDKNKWRGQSVTTEKESSSTASSSTSSTKSSSTSSSATGKGGGESFIDWTKRKAEEERIPSVTSLHVNVDRENVQKGSESTDKGIDVVSLTSIRDVVSRYTKRQRLYYCSKYPNKGIFAVKREGAGDIIFHVKTNNIPNNSNNNNNNNSKSSKKGKADAAKSRRFQLKGTGRVAFGKAGEVFDEGGVRDIFIMSSLSSSALRSDKSSQGLLDTKTGQEKLTVSGFSVGHEAAMARMKTLGEEWAEEEDLPESGGCSGEGADTTTGIAASAGQYNKMAMMSTSRQQALKKEKRK
eukprot:gene37681-49349_t